MQTCWGAGREQEVERGVPSPRPCLAQGHFCRVLLSWTSRLGPTGSGEGYPETSAAPWKCCEFWLCPPPPPSSPPPPQERPKQPP